MTHGLSDATIRDLKHLRDGIHSRGLTRGRARIRSSDAPKGNGRFLITEDADSSWETTKQDLLDSLIPLQTNSAPAPKC
jgi:hypothetical protein